MKKRYSFIIIFFLACVAMSCAVRKHLPPGTQLYKGATYEIVKEKEKKTRKKLLIFKRKLHTQNFMDLNET